MAEVQPLELRWSARSREQLLAIREYVNRRNPTAASRIGESIREAAELLRYFPYAGRPGLLAGTREWVVRGLPYIIVYEVIDDVGEVMILSVFHGAQRRRSP